LVGEWKLDEASGTTAFDTKSGYNATVLGGTAFETGKIGNALNFDNGTAGTGGKYAEMPSNAVLDNVQEGEYSISSWFYAYTAPTDLVVENRNWAVVSKFGQHLGLFYQVGQKFSARHYLADNVFLSAASTGTYALKSWHHVASVVSKTAGTVKLYVNGALAATTNFSPNSAAREYGVTPFRIGRAQYQWAANGKVDQVRIYNRALTVADISDLYGETIDNTPPTISAVGSAPASNKSAIMWMTNEGSNSSVDYGLTSGYGSTSPVQSALVTKHTVLLTGLVPQKVYHYRVRSRDAAGNTALSGDGTFATSPSGTLAAFPGAQGGGALAAGGRGGDIYQVTNLNDAGAGSLRDCMQGSHSQPRTCVFRVAGTINLLSGIRVFNPNLTVAGQTAPGGGIMIKGKANLENQIIVYDSDVVLQYLRVRTGYNAARAGNGGGAPLSISQNGVRVMADHLSLSWNTDDNTGVWDHANPGGEPHDISFSHVLIAEALQGHATAMLTGSQNNDPSARLMTNIDIHHSMTANHTHRAPHLKNMSSRLVNNIFYNNERSSTQLKGGVNADFIGNVYKPLGTRQPDNAHEINAYINTSAGGNAVIGSPSIYLLGNKGWNQTNPTGNQWLLAARTPDNTDNGKEIGPIPTGWQRGGPLAVAGVPIVADDANSVESILTGSKGVGASARLDCNGNWVANRDAVDTRLMNQYAAGTGTYPKPTLYETGAAFGWPVMSTGSACADTDLDGMPDEWEITNGLSTTSNDRNALAANGSGYTNFDMYLAGLRAQ